MLALPPHEERVPIRRCFCDLAGQRFYGEVLDAPGILGTGRRLFIDPDHQDLKREREWHANVESVFASMNDAYVRVMDNMANNTSPMYVFWDAGHKR